MIQFISRTVMVIDLLQSSLEKVLAEKDLMEVEHGKQRAADHLLEATRGKGKRTKHSHGQLFDQKYLEDNAIQLAARKEKEEQGKNDRAGESQSNRKKKERALDTENIAGLSRSVPED